MPGSTARSSDVRGDSALPGGAALSRPRWSSGQRAARGAALASSAIAVVILCQRQAAQVFAVLGGPPIEQLALLRRGLTVLPGEETARVQRMVARGEDHWIACPSADAASIPDVYLCATPCAGLHVAEAAPGAYGRNHANPFLFRLDHGEASLDAPGRWQLKPVLLGHSRVGGPQCPAPLLAHLSHPLLRHSAAGAAGRSRAL